jgi:hypothetical protein
MENIRRIRREFCFSGGSFTGSRIVAKNDAGSRSAAKVGIDDARRHQGIKVAKI